MSESTIISSEQLLNIDYEKKIKELRTVKKDLTTIIKENQKLQTELKIKNETINSLINQNFTELKSLQEKHDKIVTSLTTSYEDNINNIDNRYKQFQKSLQARLKESINTHYKISNEKINILTTQNKSLLEKLSTIQKEIAEKENEIKEINNSYNELDTLYEDYQSKYVCWEEAKKSMQQQIKEINTMYQIQSDAKLENDKIISKLSLLKEKLETELCSTKQELNRNEDIIRILSVDTEHAKKSYQDIHQKHILLLNDNVVKQNNIDEKTLEILTINSKISEIEKKNIILESTRKDLSIKITELIHQVDNLQSEVMSAQKIIHQLKIEKDVILDEKIHYVREADNFKQKLMEVENIMLEKIRQIQDLASKEKEKYICSHENKIKDIKDKNEKQMTTMQYEYVNIISDREKQVEGLTSHLKSYADNQYITLNELEKYKLMNNKLRIGQSTIDQKTSELNTLYKKETDDIKTSHKREKDILIESYNENIKKAHELNDALQNRLNQSIEALSLSKSALSNLKQTNENLKQQIQSKENNDGSFQEKYNQIKNENLSLRDKLERSIELNNTFSNKEKQYEIQIKQLQSKYSQLVALTKKGMNNSISQ